VTNPNIIRAWKDEQYRLSLSESERALLPDHPAGHLQLTDTALDGAAGGAARYVHTLADCRITVVACHSLFLPDCL
jgi:mersacidin/lichenicidin family type 2 lantibiotic